MIPDFGFYNMDCMEGMKQFPDNYSAVFSRCTSTERVERMRNDGTEPTTAAGDGKAEQASPGS